MTEPFKGVWLGLWGAEEGLANNLLEKEEVPLTSNRGVTLCYRGEGGGVIRQNIVEKWRKAQTQPQVWDPRHSLKNRGFPKGGENKAIGKMEYSARIRKGG